MRPVLTWVKSTHCGADGICVEVATLGSGRVAIRDSKQSHLPSYPVLAFSSGELAALTAAFNDEKLVGG